MNVVACYKIVPDVQDIIIKDDGNLDFSRAQMVIGEYDLVAIEAAVQLAEQTDGRAVLLSLGGKALDDSKLTKSALARGAAELYRVCDKNLAGVDALQTASVLAQALSKIDYDLVICGEGSSDLYAQQVGIMLGSLAGVTVVNAVSEIKADGDAVIVQRTLEREIETLRIKPPALFCVTTDINLPRIPQLKDILAAGKKPVTTWSLDSVGALPASAVEVVSTLAPQDVQRKQQIYKDSSEENIQKLALDIKKAK